MICRWKHWKIINKWLIRPTQSISDWVIYLTNAYFPNRPRMPFFFLTSGGRVVPTCCKPSSSSVTTSVFAVVNNFIISTILQHINIKFTMYNFWNICFIVFCFLTQRSLNFTNHVHSLDPYYQFIMHFKQRKNSSYQMFLVM